MEVDCAANEVADQYGVPQENYVIRHGITDQVVRVMKAAGVDLAGLKDLRVLDLACGSSNSYQLHQEVLRLLGEGEFARKMEPWMCRTLHHLGVKKVMGIDLAVSEQEIADTPWDLRRVDLSDPQALRKALKRKIFDLVIVNNFFLGGMTGSGLPSQDAPELGYLSDRDYTRLVVGVVKNIDQVLGRDGIASINGTRFSKDRLRALPRELVVHSIP